MERERPRTSTMKTTVAVFVSVLSLALIAEAKITLPDELKELLEETHKICLKDNPVNQEILDKALTGDLTDDPQLKCFMKCMVMQLQAMDETGKLNLDLIEATLPPELHNAGAMETLKKCTQNNPDLCQATYDMVVCMGKENPELAKLFE